MRPSGSAASMAFAASVVKVRSSLSTPPDAFVATLGSGRWVLGASPVSSTSGAHFFVAGANVLRFEGASSAARRRLPGAADGAVAEAVVGVEAAWIDLRAQLRRARCHFRGRDASGAAVGSSGSFQLVDVDLARDTLRPRERRRRALRRSWHRRRARCRRRRSAALRQSAGSATRQARTRRRWSGC